MELILHANQGKATTPRGEPGPCRSSSWWQGPVRKKFSGMKIGVCEPFHQSTCHTHEVTTAQAGLYLQPEKPVNKVSRTRRLTQGKPQAGETIRGAKPPRSPKETSREGTIETCLLVPKQGLFPDSSHNPATKLPQGKKEGTESKKSQREPPLSKET